MKWIFLATVCAYFVFASAEDASEDAVVSLVLAQPSELTRQKRDQVEVVDISSRGGHRRRNKHRGGSNGAQQYPSYPTGFGGGPSGTGSQSGSWSSSQSSSWSNGGLTNSNSQSQSGASSQGGHGGSGSSSSSNAGSGSWGGNGVSGSQSKSEAQSHAQGGNTGSSSGAESSADAKGGFQFPGQYQ